MRMGRSSLLRLTWRELRRRKVTRVGAIYAVVAWVVLQLAEITFEPLGLPPQALTWTVLGAVLGFPVALILAWFFEVSPQGLVRERGVGHAAGRVFALLVVLVTVAGLGWWLAEVYGEREDSEAPALAAAPRDPAAGTRLAANAIAVLPFEDMSPAADHRHLADGMAEELIDRLARLQGLRVAARTSSFALRGFSGRVQDIGELLGVRWVLEGSVRRSEGRVRINAQLIDAREGFHAWSETYERAAEDLFALQDEVTAAIAGELERRITGVGGEARAQAGTRDTQALELYLRARQAWRARTPAGLAEAERLFQQAVERDPDYAQAWSGLADTYLLLGDYGLLPSHQSIERAEPAAVRAITLDPSLGEAWASVGLLRSQAGQLGPARRSLEEAIRLDPRYEMAPMWLAGVLGQQGLVDEQRRVLQRAHELNPLEPVINVNLAALLAAGGEREAARAQLERVLAITPDDPLLLRSLANIEFNAGDFARALPPARRAVQIDPAAPTSVSTLVQILNALEAFEESAAVLAHLPETSPYRMSLAQGLNLQQGRAELVPGLAEHVEGLMQGFGSVTAQDRELILSAALAQLETNPGEAVRLLRRVVPEPAAIEGDGNLLDAASALVTALQRAGLEMEAEPYYQALDQTAERLLDGAPDTAQSTFSRAMVAEYRGERDAALAHFGRAIELGWRQRWILRHDPRLAALRTDPRWLALDARLAEALAEARREARIGS